MNPFRTLQNIIDIVKVFASFTSSRKKDRCSQRRNEIGIPISSINVAPKCNIFSSKHILFGFPWMLCPGKTKEAISNTTKYNRYYENIASFNLDFQRFRRHARGHARTRRRPRCVFLKVAGACLQALGLPAQTHM